MQVSSVFKPLDLSKCIGMYEREHLGIVVFKDVIRDDFKPRLRQDMIRFRDEFRSYWNNAVANNGDVYTFANLCTNIITNDPAPSNILFWEGFRQLAGAYAKEIYSEVSWLERFRPAGSLLNSCIVHCYPENYGRLSYHRDFATETNLIGAISVIGSATFMIAQSKLGANEERHVVEPGDMVLMRANKNKTFHPANDLRPWHAVQTLGEDRYSIMLRNEEDP